MDGYVVIGTELDTKDFDAEIKYIESQLEEIEYKFKKADMGFDVGDTEKLEAQYSRLSKQLDRLQKKQADLNKTDLSKVQKSIENIGNSTGKTIKKLGKWVLGIFAIESAYGFVRKTISTISQYNEGIAKDIEYINFALASMLQPVIEGLINLAYKLLTYVNYIAKAWFGVNLFANASAKAMEKGSKSADKMKKSLAGFDEMNVLQDTSTSGTGGATTPSFDLSQWQGEVPSWVQWIADNKDLVIGGLLAIGTALLLLNLGGLVTNLSGIGTLLSLIWGILQPLFTFIGENAIVIGGIIIIVGGLVLAIQGLINYLKDPTWENFGTMLLGIGIIATGVLLIFGGFPALITLIIGAVVALGVAIYKNWDKIVQFTKELVQKIKDAFGGAIDWVKERFNSMVSFFSGLISKIVGLFKTIGTKVGDAIGGAFKTVINGVLKAIETILNKPINAINNLLDVINAVPGIDLGRLPTFKLPRLAKGGIVNNPGRGVMMGNYIAGEKGAEAVLPLTDNTLQRLANMIPITINLTNTMNGRVISRELQKINNNSDFARNV